MLSRKLPGTAAVAGTIVVGLPACLSTASSWSASPVQDEATYLPVQSISYGFGSKSVSGYFVRQSAGCVVTLMITEKGDPEEHLRPSPARVRFVLSPGQITGLDSEEGRSLNLTCGADVKTLSVDVGERDRLAALQARAPRAMAVTPQWDEYGHGHDPAPAETIRALGTAPSIGTAVR
ncbi:MAG TPA: hypothetical protein VE914_19875 [Candidatus Angelobacter sp.]|nr:hypothetical protein [Candidatus Angelobacter sp.]